MPNATGVLDKAGYELKLLDAPAKCLTKEEALKQVKDFNPALVVIDTWIQRFLYRTFDKKARKTIHRQVASCDVAERRIELLNKWGL